MIQLVFYASVSVLLLLILLKLFLQSPRLNHQHNQPLTIQDFLPVHHREFEDVDRRLTEYDALLQRIRSERRDVIFSYLNALRNDFVRVDQLLTCAAKFLPQTTLEGESERFWLGVKFRFEYRLACLQMFLGFVPAVRLKELTQKVRKLADWADKALSEIAQECGLPFLQSHLNF